MAKQHQALQAIKIPLRPGEGTVIEVNRRAMPRPDGTVGFQIGIDLANAPVPERRYVADAANVTYTNGSVYIIFWQKKISGNEARSMVILTVASVAALMYLLNTEEQIAQFEKVSGQYKMEACLEKLPEEPPQAVCLAANIIATAWSAREACMDFYYASPFVMGTLEKNGKFAAEPMVRVSLPTAVLIAIWRQMQSFKSSFPKDELDAFEKSSSRAGEGTND